LTHAAKREVKAKLEIKVDASEIKKEKDDAVKSLVDFLKDKTNADVSADAEMVTVKGEGDAVTKKYIKVLVKKFLHQQELKETFRVIMDAEEENTLVVKERRLYEDQE
jgi:archaellum component FlaG (FlaF/FlaG flagellin family)